MKNDFLNGKRQREKEESFEAIEKDMMGEESFKGKKPKLEEKQLENSEMSPPQKNQLNSLDSENNLEFKDISELAFNYNSTKINIKCKICSKNYSFNDFIHHIKHCQNYLNNNESKEKNILNFNPNKLNIKIINVKFVQKI